MTKKKTNFIIFFFFINLTILFAQETKPINFDEELCQLAANGSFNGRLTSITFGSDGEELIFFLDSKKAIIVPSKMIFPKVININGVYVKTKTLPLDVTVTMKSRGANNFGFYLLDGEISGNYQAMVVSEREVLLVSYENSSNSSRLDVKFSTPIPNPTTILQSQEYNSNGFVLGKMR